jgi:hypothetical protein
MNKLVSLVSNWYQDTTDTGLKLVSMVSHPFRGDTTDTNYLTPLRGEE